MTVFKHPKGAAFRYDFWWRGDRYTGNTLQTDRAEAELVEASIKKDLRLRAGGLLPPAPTTSPSFQDWAEIYLEHVVERRKDITRSDRIEDLLRVVLRFWGRRPPANETGKFAAREGEPYHDLRLVDPIQDPMWLLKFDDWMNSKVVGRTKRPIGGQTKNQYRSVLSQMYRLALQPAYRSRTGVTMNPFVGIPRDKGHERTSTVSVDELRAWLSHASYHVRLAVAIAALAPKLRLANILKLRWKQDIDRGYRYITVHEHKTEGHTKRPLVVPIDEQLRLILEDARKRAPRAKHVVTYRGEPVEQIRGGVQAAAKAAGLTWGRFQDAGVTFHTIRHTMATMLAELPELDGEAALSESVRKEAMGHQRLETTQRYTHIRPAIERSALARLSKVTPIADVVMQPRTRATRGKSIGTAAASPLGTGRRLRQRKSKSKIAS
jgi:integrase